MIWRFRCAVYGFVVLLSGDLTRKDHDRCARGLAVGVI